MAQALGVLFLIGLAALFLKIEEADRKRRIEARDQIADGHRREQASFVPPHTMAYKTRVFESSRQQEQEDLQEEIGKMMRGEA